MVLHSYNPNLRRLRQEDYKMEVSLGFKVRLSKIYI
jgi:hypothetical protein